MKWLPHLVLTLAAMALAYLCGAFYEAAWDITTWDHRTRVLVILGFLCHFSLHPAVALESRA